MEGKLKLNIADYYLCNSTFHVSSFNKLQTDGSWFPFKVKFSRDPFDNSFHGIAKQWCIRQ